MKLAVTLAVLASIVAKTTFAALPPNVVALMDTTADPCEDFYQYSCGTWLKDTTIPPSQVRTDPSFTAVGNQAEVVIQQIVQEKLPFVGEFWDACMDTDRLEKIGVKPLEKQLDRIVHADDRAEVFNIAGQLRRKGTQFITNVGVGGDLKNASLNVLWVDAASLVLPDPTYYTDNDTFSELERPYRTYITTVMNLAGFGPGGKFQQRAPSPSQQQQQQKPAVLSLNAIADRIIALEQTIAPWIPDESGDGDPFQFYHPIAIGDAKHKYQLSFGKFSLGLGLLDKSSLKSSSSAIFGLFDYFDKVEAFLKKTELVDLKLYLAFRYIDQKAIYLNAAFSDADYQLNGKTINGQKEPSPRKKVCVDREKNFFPDLIGTYYFQKMFDQIREDNAKLMVSSIEAAMSEHIAKLDWLDDVTRVAAEAKLKKVANLIGHSTEVINYPFKLHSDKYFDNVETISEFSFDVSLKNAGKPVNRQHWEMSAAEVNAYYSPPENKMVFPAAILQPPFFNGTSHPAQNFGAIGVVVGHELTHGFDSSGRRYDGDGNVRNWWDESTTVEFDKRAQCMRDEYSNFTIYGESGQVLMNVNGSRTIGENIADNGGFSLSWDAYHEYIKTATNVPSNGLLPGEDEKLFFVSYAQMWCAKYRDGAMLQRLQTNPHSPGIARTNGVVMNTPHFAPTFQCKVGTKMNPEKKCQLW